MSHRLRSAGLGFLALLGLALLMFRATQPSPALVYGGKTTAQWLDAGYEDASLALHQIGPAAAPCILDKLVREDPQYGSLRRYREFRDRLPSPLQRFFPKPATGAFDELHACSALLELGAGVIPLLCSSLRSHNPVVREVSAHALGSFRQQGKDFSRVTPLLLEALHDPVAGVRKRAVWALAQQSPSLK